MGPKSLQKIDKETNKSTKLHAYTNDSKIDNVFTSVDEVSKSKYTTDKFGNTVLKAKAEEDAKLDAMRAAAKARRAEKEAAAAAQTQQAETVAPLAKEKSSAALSIEEVRRKFDSGLKLTHKEKKLLESFDRSAAKDALLTVENASGLSSFSLSAQATDVSEGTVTKCYSFIKYNCNLQVRVFTPTFCFFKMVK